MIRSMTGYARISISGAWRELSWELKSVNGRYLDLSIHSPEDFRFLESEVRGAIAEQVNRGKLSAQLRYRPLETQKNLQPNVTQVRQIETALAAIRDAGLVVGAIDPLAVLAWPGVLEATETDFETLREPLLDALKQSIAAFIQHRAAEGGRIAEMLRDRARQIGEIVVQVRQRLPELRAEQRTKIQARLQDALATIAATPDTARLEQELALIAQRQDVDEELDRIESHLKELESTLKRKEPVGRRLDFLMQEFNREANTLGSKSQDVTLTRAAVDIKVLIEQMREQVQNVE